MKNLRVENPCPMYLGRMKKNGTEFFCESCKKEVIDFRNKNNTEINNIISSNICGVFTSDQLQGQKKMPLIRKVTFFSLMIFSILGFNVNPLSAQTENKSDSLEVKKQNIQKEKDNNKKILNEGRKTKKIDKAKRTGLFRRRKKKEKKVIGCPSF